MKWSTKDIKAFEKEFSVTCALRPDGMYDVECFDSWSGHATNGSININNRGLIELKYLLPPIYTLSGDLYCSFNNLVTLKGAPMRIIGSLSCFDNNLIDLEGAPIHIERNFGCGSNDNLRFTRSQLDAMNIKGDIHMDPEQLIPDDPSEFIEKGILPI